MKKGYREKLLVILKTGNQTFNTEVTYAFQS
jgi:hypothetical protein